MHASNDVLVVVAGPIGPMAAGELAGAGARCTIVERRAEESDLTRAFAVHARTMELLDARELVARGQPVGQIELFGDVTVDLTRLPSRFAFLLVSLRQDEDGVDIYVRARDGAAQTLRAAYVIGADCARTGVRQALGQPFPGRSVLRSVILAEVRMSQRPDQLSVSVARDALSFLAALPNRSGSARMPPHTRPAARSTTARWTPVPATRAR